MRPSSLSPLALTIALTFGVPAAHAADYYVSRIIAGNVGMTLAADENHFCALSHISGKFMGGGEYVRVYVPTGASRWKLETGSQQDHLAAGATCVHKQSFAYRPGTQYWRSPEFSVSSLVGSSLTGRCGPAPLSSYRETATWWGDAFTVLTGFRGKLDGAAEVVNIMQSAQPYAPSYISSAVGQCDALVSGQAHAYFVGTPHVGERPVFMGPRGSGLADVAGEYHLRASQQQRSLVLARSDEAWCYLTGVSGRFKGGGEVVQMVRETHQGQMRWVLRAQHQGAQGDVAAWARCVSLGAARL